MFTISIEEPYHTTFLKNISGKSDSTNFLIHIEHDRSHYIYPHVGTFSVGDIDISIKQEGPPVSCGGLAAYFTRITASHENLQVLRDFVSDACQEPDVIGDAAIKIFSGNSRGFFKPLGELCAQRIDRIYTPEKTKKLVLSHIDTFLASKSRYVEFGRLYKTSFLLTGPPGTGKTSLIKAIALKYKKPVYLIPFTKQLSDEGFIDMVGDIKDDSIVLIEDIDGFFVDREAVGINISFSAFINFLDGAIGSAQGIITFLTANNPDRLDPALIRPGRVDRVVEFGPPRKPEIKNAFDDLTACNPNFEAFYQAIPKEISMAGIIEYLFRNGTDPIGSIDDLKNQAAIKNNMFN
jgi:hypothetical protein